MKTMTFTSARENFASMYDSVLEDAEETVVTRQGHEPIVVLSLKEYESMRETMYLLRSPRNADRLLSAIARDRAGETRTHQLIDPDVAPVAT
ncbi:MAG: type II toxin-antitoxin system prevent-host-death family antitoxin [Promicromonosporaceae bacterium]|nr:type II toxin-antitoxin system prevent-host-death family antitoxin [Promicromonosporaceae bacterium]